MAISGKNDSAANEQFVRMKNTYAKNIIKNANFYTLSAFFYINHWNGGALGNVKYFQKIRGKHF